MVNRLQTVLLMLSILPLTTTSQTSAAPVTRTQTFNLSGVSLEFPEFFSGFESRIDFSFNVQQEFLSIETLAVEVVGSGQEGSADVGVGEPARSFGPDLDVSIGSQLSDRIGPFGFSGTETVVFSSPTDDFSNVLSGEGFLTLELAPPGFPFVDVFQSARLDFSSATLSITGEPIPEPGAGMLAVTIAGLMLAKRRSRLSTGSL
ncbi:MAG: hypothetical protein MI923_14080 [Phycisphaerales bacterium]|nr:hypothetical protein [Phycisphaerales bacterium]